MLHVFLSVCWVIKNIDLVLYPFLIFQANSNSENIRLVQAMLCAALYPNIVQVMTPEQRYVETGAGAIPKAPKPEDLKFKTKADGYVSTVEPSLSDIPLGHPLY